MTSPNTRVLRRFAWLAWLAPLFLGGLTFGQNGALRVTEPPPSKNAAIFTSEPAIPLQGTLSWTGGDMRVLWQSNRGFSDLAAVTVAEDGRTVLWNAASPVPLRPGINHVRIMALGQPGAATFVNVYYTPKATAAPAPIGTAILRGKQIAYEVIGGMAVYQGDIILGKPVDVAAGRFSGRFAVRNRQGLRPQSATIAPNLLSSTGLWPVVNGVVRVPYTIANPATDPIYPLINDAINKSNSQLAGVVQWAPATTSDVNLVNFDFNTSDMSGSCEAIVGMEGGTQAIGGSGNCTTGTILHEMGHALGLLHEQSRIDRDTYVNYMEQNIDKPQHGNFDIVDPGADSGLYNYASIMEYGPFSFNRDGVSPTLETIPPGMVLGTDMPQYTTGDLDGIERLYAHVPAAITVDTNPSGLQVIVDSTPCTAPCAFSNWALGSQHTLSVPLDSHSQTLQTLSQQNYIFGRWNAGAANEAAVTITNAAGDGTLLSPSTSPAITNYLASFIPVHPYSPVVYPAGSGTISNTPAASTLIVDGVSTNYYVDRQRVTLTVTPSSGYNFYKWVNLYAYNFYSNPYAFYITTNFDYYDFDTSHPTEVLMVDAVTTIAGASPDIGATGIFQGFAIGVVQNSNGNSAFTYNYTPENFDATYDLAGFAAGASLTLCGSTLSGTNCPAAPVAQSPTTLNISYLFHNWSGAASGTTDGVSVTVPASGHSTYTANYTPSFRTIVEPSLYCRDGSGNNLLNVTSTPTDRQSARVSPNRPGNRDGEFQHPRGGSAHNYQHLPCNSHRHEQGGEPHGERHGIRDGFVVAVHLLHPTQRTVLIPTQYARRFHATDDATVSGRVGVSLVLLRRACKLSRRSGDGGLLPDRCAERGSLQLQPLHDVHLFGCQPGWTARACHHQIAHRELRLGPTECAIHGSGHQLGDRVRQRAGNGDGSRIAGRSPGLHVGNGLGLLHAPHLYDIQLVGGGAELPGDHRDRRCDGECPFAAGQFGDGERRRSVFRDGHRFHDDHFSGLGAKRGGTHSECGDGCHR